MSFILDVDDDDDYNNNNDNNNNIVVPLEILRKAAYFLQMRGEAFTLNPSKRKNNHLS